jgi:hypothetical protein
VGAGITLAGFLSARGLKVKTAQTINQVKGV